MGLASILFTIYRAPTKGGLRKSGEGKTVKNPKTFFDNEGANHTQLKNDLVSLNTIPIVFYGKVIDQNGTSLSGIKMEAKVIIDRGGGRQCITNYVYSGPDGKFQVVDIVGEKLITHCRNDAYRPMYTTNTFVYSKLFPDRKRHFPDPEKPVEFMLWKRKGEMAPLTKINFRLKELPTNQSIFINLLTGNREETTGDLVVNFTPFQKNDGFWYATIQTPSGGIIPVDFGTWKRTYEAPEMGWTNQFRIEPKKIPLGYSFLSVNNVFMSLRDKQMFAKLRLSLWHSTDSGNPGFRVEGFTTTNYSRSWEGQSPSVPLF